MNVIANTFVGLKCLTETKIQILYDHVDHTRFHVVEMGCQIVQLFSGNVRQFDPSQSLLPLCCQGDIRAAVAGKDL